MLSVSVGFHALTAVLLSIAVILGHRVRYGHGRHGSRTSFSMARTSPPGERREDRPAYPPLSAASTSLLPYAAHISHRAGQHPPTLPQSEPVGKIARRVPLASAVPEIAERGGH